MARLTEERDLGILDDADERRVKSRIWRIGDDLPALVDLELAPESREMVSKADDFWTPAKVALRVKPGRGTFFGDSALRTDFMTRSSSCERLVVLDFRLSLASISFSRLDSWI